MRLVALIVFVFIAVCGLPSISFAWGRMGHHIVAEIAFHYLDSVDQKKLLSYLGDMSIEDASTWLDDVRDDPKYKFTAPWHYVNIPKGKEYEPNNDVNIINSLNDVIYDLRKYDGKLTPEQIKFDLLTLMHLIGDLNQPLHMGYAEDKGGNLYQVSYLGQGSNLHRVWDSQIIETANITFDSCLAWAEAMPSMETQLIVAGSLANWTGFPRRIVDTIYPVSHKIDMAYVERMTPVIKQQLVRAGFELAKTLHEDLENIPVANNQSAKKDANEPVKEIGLNDLSAHLSETVKVCGKVYGVKYLSNGGGKPTFVNIGAAYPNSPLTLVIWQDVRDSFNVKPENLDGKNICATGKLELYKGKPEIIIKQEDDIVTADL